jgi:nitrite reductase/ring-hydroxylating ferredoxin subunit
MDVITLCNINDLEEGNARGFIAPGFRRKIILILKAGQVHAYLDACPHYPTGTPMAWKTDAYLDGEKKHIACHSHGALFDIETGACVLGPCLGQSLQKIQISIQDSGDISIGSQPA